MKRFGIFTGMVLAAFIAVHPTGSLAAGSNKEKCDRDRANAWGAYEACVAGVAGTYYEVGDHASMQDELVRCRGLHLKWPLPHCGNIPRFRIKAGSSVIIDNLSGLIWERKNRCDNGWKCPRNVTATACACHSWNTQSPIPGGRKPDGTAFTAFLPALNQPGLFKSHAWRLPTMAELLSTFHTPAPCTTQQCNLASMPNRFNAHADLLNEAGFGDGSARWWSETTSPRGGVGLPAGNIAWDCGYGNGCGVNGKGGSSKNVRAVLGGMYPSE